MFRTSSVNTEEPNVDEVTGQRAELPQCDEFPVHDQLLHSYADEDTVHCDELPQSVSFLTRVSVVVCHLRLNLSQALNQ